VEGLSQETRFIKAFFFRGWNPSLVETLTNLAADAETGFLLHLVEGLSQETRFIKGFFAMNRSGTVRFFQFPAKKIVKFFFFRQKAMMHKAMVQKARDAKFTPNTSIAQRQQNNCEPPRT